MEVGKAGRVVEKEVGKAVEKEGGMEGEKEGEMAEEEVEMEEGMANSNIDIHGRKCQNSNRNL